ncbi:LacI family DNA-binding transcriptional regulator [Roseicyclus marinus]|uniref:LacI family DNA-binding transcriptional regulator n=1 Tax=Roseicyclus marinus TaxID=2161673 RepID=UPI00240FE162|nr:LacI family DNA-binding transcriptional regulator [Roseicyclus marinus]MDG3042345.1 LacI family DNA-binding transcriptional regulator [Roseicyclus marinus]
MSDAPAKVTAHDVARLAGVSQSAVSRVFTPGASASKATVAKVRAAAEQLGYRPDPLARAMITGRTRIIGLVVAYLENQFYPMALERLSRALQDRGYHILVFMAENSTEKVAEVVQELIDYRVDGIITASVSMSNDLTARLLALGIPVVNFNRGQDDARLTDITSDNVAGGRRATEFLIAGGHERIAHVMGWQGSSTGRDRAEGFRQAMAAAGLAPVAMVDGMFARDTAAAAARAMCEGPDRPDAIFVGNDHMAFAVMDELRFGLGLDVPGEISIVGYDDVPMAAWPAYDLTTIRQPVNRMVEATTTAILGLIDGTASPQKTRIDGPLMVRRSARIPQGYKP